MIISVTYQKQKSKTILGDIALLNIEALAQDEGSGNCAEWITKNCYEVFTSEYGSDYYCFMCAHNNGEVWQNVELLNLINLLECLKLRLVLNVLDSTNIYIT